MKDMSSLPRSQRRGRALEGRVPSTEGRMGALRDATSHNIPPERVHIEHTLNGIRWMEILNRNFLFTFLRNRIR